MSRTQKILVAILLVCAAAGGVRLFLKYGQPQLGEARRVVLVGSVLRENSDPNKQTPLAGVTVTAMAHGFTVSGKTNAVGYFSLPLTGGAGQGEPVQIHFQTAGFQPLEMTANQPGDQLYIARLTPLAKKALDRKTAETPAKIVLIRNIQVRYSYKDRTTMGVGSFAKQFSVNSKGNVPCDNQRPCSPDGRWKATVTTLPLDAGEGNTFRNIRVSCMAGPCAFTKLENDRFGDNERKIDVSVLDWSDSADYLVEADITRTMVTDQVRMIYPFLLEQTMNFALPSSSEGPAIEADYDGQYIVFPLGPDLILTWANCTLEISPEKNKVYRCQLKPGYRFAM